MGIRESHSIDIVLKRPPFETEACKLVLLVIDATSDLNEDERCALLHKKLAAYYSYVSSPALLADHPSTKPEDVIIRVLTVTPPP